MLVPFPGTKDFDYFFSDMPLKDIEWDKFVAVGKECVLKNSEVSSEEIIRIIGKANILYYAHPLRLLNVLRHIKTLYEFTNYLQGGLALMRQIWGWFQKRNVG